MERVIVPAKAGQNIRLDISGPVDIKGWDRPEVRIELSDTQHLSTQESNGDLIIECAIGCGLALPETAVVIQAQIGGSASVKNIQGDLEFIDVGGSFSAKNCNNLRVEQVGGSLTLKSMEGDAALGQISGSLSAKNIGGELAVEQVSGSTALRGINGNVVLKGLTGSLSLRDVGPDLNVDCAGNASLELADLGGGNFVVRAGGNVFCQLPGADDAQIELHSGSGNIYLQSPSGSQALHSQDHNLTLGEGLSQVRIDAAGSISLDTGKSGPRFTFDVGFDDDWLEDFEVLADEISEQVNSQVESQLAALDSKLENLRVRLQVAGGGSQRHLREAERRTRAAQRRLQRKLERAQRTRPGRPPTKQAEPVSEAERLTVLQMLQEKKISVDEAEVLLRALEGAPTVSASPAPQAPVSPVPPAPPEPPLSQSED